MCLQQQQESSQLRNWTHLSVVSMVLVLSLLVKCKASSLPTNSINTNNGTTKTAANVTAEDKMYPIVKEDVVALDKVNRHGPAEQEDAELTPDEEGDYGGYRWQFSEYSLNEVHPGPPNLECYTCHFSKWRWHEQGMSNCDDPFDPEGIPTVICEGLCAKTKTMTGEGEYMIIRSCLPGCKDVSDTQSSIECCYGTRCNGSHVAVLMIAANVTVCAIVFMLGILFICAC